MLTILSGRSRAKLDALEALKARVMIADAKLNITYINGAVRDLLTEAESDLKAELPRFSVGTLVGSNIDVFHKNPAHQRGMLAGLKTSHKATIRVGRHVFDLIVTPLLDGETITSYAVEWTSARERMKNLDFENRMNAVDRVQAVVEFTPDGEIITANANFLKAVGYSIEEITGRHHSIFVGRQEVESAEYKAFWKALSEGEHRSGEFSLAGKGGKTAVFNASYNPIPDDRGRIARIVVFATDVTDRVHSVRLLGEGLNKLASGDLGFRLHEQFPRDFESLRLDFNAALGELSGTMDAVAQTTVEIDAGSSEVSRSADDLSRRTEQQAASLEETAAALDEITVNMQKAAERSDEARKAAEKAKVSAGHSAKVMQDATDAMARIEDSSDKISSIIGVIDEISFQTNLLALNAGVEAARAGEAGKGFAVVAQEVRELAQRAATAAKEIKQLIVNSSEEVRGGVRLVSETSEALRTIESNILVVNEQMQAIAIAAREQASGLDEVNVAINQMDQVTQQNAAMVEESNAASATLAGQAERLRSLLERFRLGDTAPPAAVRPAASGRAPVRRAVHGNTALKRESWEEF